MDALILQFAGDAARVAVVLAIALGALTIVRTPAARRVLLATALVGALFMPAVAAIAPARVGVPVADVTARFERDGIRDGAAAAPAVASPIVSVSVGPRTASSAFSFPRIDWLAVGGAIWLLGALVVLARVVGGNVRAARLVRAATPARDWDRVVERARRITSVRADVRVADIAAPAVTGIIAPVVLVPVESWSDERRLTVLLHEIAHIRQRDCALNLAAQIACAMHWFNPLAWIAARRLRFERELAADEAVLAAGTRASSYAEDLLAIASAAADDVPASALGMGARTHLATRITAIIADRVRGPRRTALVAAGTSALALGVACTHATPAEHDIAQVSTPAQVAAPTTGTSDLQKIATEEHARLMADSHANAAAIVIVDPNTGAVLAEAGVSRTPYVTGSTLKPLVLATALDTGVVTADDKFDCEQGEYTYAGKTMHDYAKHGVLSVSDMLAVSSNVGFTKLFERMGAARLEKGLTAFHIAAPPLHDHEYKSAVAAIGEVATIPPVDLARAYVPLANGGEYIDGSTRTRVLKSETVNQLRPMLENVVYNARGTGNAAAVDGLRVAGKTGTADKDLPNGGQGTWASFVGFVPSTAPRFVILVGADLSSEGSGGAVAAPVFSRVATRVLATK